MAMPNEYIRPPKDNPIILRAALLLSDSLAELDATQSEQQRLRAKIDDVLKQINPLLIPLDPARIGPAERARIKSLRLRHTALQKSLERANQAETVARQRFVDRREEYAEAFDRHSIAQADLHATLRQSHRQSSAIERTVLELFETEWAATARDLPSATFEMPKGSYSYIPMAIPKYLSMLSELDMLLSADPAYAGDDTRYRPVSFLEVGCGPGRNVVIAQSCGLCRFSHVSGFDIDSDAIDIGLRAFGANPDLSVADAMTNDYSTYDVVFSFRPFSNAKKQEQLEARISETMRKDAYLLAPLSHDLGLYPSLIPVDRTHDIWKKID